MKLSQSQIDASVALEITGNVQAPDASAIKTLTCGCCSNGCCCWHHRDEPNGRPAKACAVHSTTAGDVVP